jgi:hypothetical protein
MLYKKIESLSIDFVAFLFLIVHFFNYETVLSIVLRLSTKLFETVYKQIILCVLRIHALNKGGEQEGKTRNFIPKPF